MQTIKKFLSDKGVTDDESLARHTQFILDTEERTQRRFNLNGYGIDPCNPNAFPPMMG